jgi:hypothetical protein
VIVAGPVALVTPKLAHAIEAPLGRAVEKARRDGVRLDEDVLALMRDVRHLAELYRRGVTGRVTDANRSSDAASDAGSEVEPGSRTLDSMEVSARAGISAHGVTEAARRGRLVGRRVEGRWTFSPEAVELWLRDRERTA